MLQGLPEPKEYQDRLVLKVHLSQVLLVLPGLKVLPDRLVLLVLLVIQVLLVQALPVHPVPMALQDRLVQLEPRESPAPQEPRE